MKRLALLAAALVAAASAIPGADLTVSYTFADGNVHALADGATIVFPNTDINTTATAIIEIYNPGNTPAAVYNAGISGTTFRLNNPPVFPATLATGQSLRFGVVFAPTQAGSYTGVFRIDVGGRSITALTSGSTTPPNMSLAYIDPETNNVVSVQDGSALSFPSTAAGSSSLVTVLVGNSGAGTGVIDSIVLATTPPSAFQLQNLPPLPALVPASQQVRFNIRFNPPRQQMYSAALRVTLNGRMFTINLQAQGSGFTYTYGPNGAQVVPGASITVADTAVGQTGTMQITVANPGNTDALLASASVTGTGFSLSELPPLPYTVRAGSSTFVTLKFTPTEPGPASGLLIIGNDTFTVNASGIGPHLIYSYTSAGTAIPVAEGGIVIFPPLEVGKSEKLQFTLQNSGTSAAIISTINLAVPGTSFALEQLPALPFNLAQGGKAAFTIGFTPGTTGELTAALRINSASMTLSGSGSQPPVLPSYQFQAPAAAVQPAQQPAIGLTLASPYPAQIDGTLKLTFASSVFTDDPSIQFATGGRTANFTIPANSTQALFNGSPTMALQTGTTAGTIVVTPSFAMQSGFDMTPPTPDNLTISIARAVPQVLSASITAQTTTGFTLVLNGYSTTRALRQLDVEFTPKDHEQNFAVTRLTIDVSSASAAWYQGPASQTTGGSFLAAIPFVLQNGSTGEDLVHRLQSIRVTATNEAGVSAPVTTLIP